MALNNQIHILSIDTGFFYTRKELAIHRKSCIYKREKAKIKLCIDDIKQQLSLLLPDEEFSKALKKDYCSENEEVMALVEKLRLYNQYKKIKNKRIVSSKKILLSTIKNRLDSNRNPSTRYVRTLRSKSLKDDNTISIFESTLTRTIGAETDSFIDDIMVVQVYYFDIIQDIILHGFMHNGEKYKYFTSSAGQIRTKKTVFIKESVWEKHELSLMCGLTLDKINHTKVGTKLDPVTNESVDVYGMNINKFLAYLALCNSATDLWESFDINKTIVVSDFETKVWGEVDFIDEKDYTISRKGMDVPITHTDGCGMMLPTLSSKNFMVRLPFVKGLLAVFDFRKFIISKRIESDNPRLGIVKDIYGDEHDVIAEGIQVIFTESQFKMYKYYANWEEYKDCFVKYKCQAGICNVEEDRIPNAQINYQMLQTLTNLTKEDMERIASNSINKLKNITTTTSGLLDVFGVKKHKKNQTYLQEALAIYPELFRDTYIKDQIRDIKNSLIKRYRAGKLEVQGKFTFIVPDLYAFCEHLFLDKDVPTGLLGKNEVMCKMFPKAEKLDCLRSPHLFREHAVRKNVLTEQLSEWFTTDAIYTSTNDLMSKILQFDVDGDRSLVIADKFFVDKAEEVMEGVVPLFYNMGKAQAERIQGQSLYNGLNAAFTGGNIGVISNDITKIWNGVDWNSAKKDEKEEALKVIKLLCCENNFVIDYAKTLYKPTRPDDINQLIRKYTKSRVPHFFMYAKDKLPHQVEPVTQTCVNWLEDIVKDFKLSFKKVEFGVLDYTQLMSDPQIEIDPLVIDTYNKINRTYHFKINMESEYKSNLSFIAKMFREELFKLGYSEDELTDMIVKYLFEKKSRYKEGLWFVFGETIVKNLKANLKNKTHVCLKCGKRFEINSNNQNLCTECSEKNKKKLLSKTIRCQGFDGFTCNKELTIPTSSRITRCSECISNHKRLLKKQEMQRYRQRKQVL